MLIYNFIIFNSNQTIYKKINSNQFESFQSELKTKYKNYTYIYTIKYI